MNKTFLLLITILLLTSCSNEIDRNQANELLKSEIGYPYVEFDQANWNIWYFQDKGKYIVDDPKSSRKMNIKELVDKGLIDLTNGSRTTGFLYQQRKKNTYRYSLSAKSKSVLWDNNSLNTSFNYWIAQLPMYEVELNEITGIKFEDEKKTKATIEYTEKVVNQSPFTQLSGKTNRENIVSRTANAELYDDGWRITSTGLPKDIKKKKVENLTAWNSILNAEKTKEAIQNDIIAENKGEPETENVMAVINDPDGYTNLREKPNSSSKILTKIYDGESFEVYVNDSPEKWWLIYHQKSQKTGYIHKSRVKFTN